MSKLGDEYQEIVGLVRQALDPCDVVKTGQWIEGPDGERDLDVEVRGMRDGKEQFILIECKDWKRKVGIGVVDALESKRHDLGADAAAIYSNSGFTEPALRKANRVGIRAFSALRAGDERIKFVVSREVVATAIAVENYSIRIFATSDPGLVFPNNWKPTDVKYDGLPLVNFLRDESLQILKQHGRSSTITVSYVFNEPGPFYIADRQIELEALQVTMKCSEKYVSQAVQENVTLGHYDFFNGTVAIPAQQAYIVGAFDNRRWVDVDMRNFKVESNDLQPNSFQFGLKLYKAIGGVSETQAPNLADRVKLKEVRVED